MKMNVGLIDKVLRIVIGAVLTILAAAGIFTPWGWIGIIPLATGIIGWCPAYQVLGLNTCPLTRNKEK
jgi:hypothetical protein